MRGKELSGISPAEIVRLEIRRRIRTFSWQVSSESLCISLSKPVMLLSCKLISIRPAALAANGIKILVQKLPREEQGPVG